MIRRSSKYVIFRCGEVGGVVRACRDIGDALHDMRIIQAVRNTAVCARLALGDLRMHGFACLDAIALGAE